VLINTNEPQHKMISLKTPCIKDRDLTDIGYTISSISHLPHETANPTSERKLICILNSSTFYYLNKNYANEAQICGQMYSYGN